MTKVHQEIDQYTPSSLESSASFFYLTPLFGGVGHLNRCCDCKS
jgi:hypothetical protein